MRCNKLSFFHDKESTEIYTLSLHDPLPICHTGGLENLLSNFMLLYFIHRHTGGLENFYASLSHDIEIHRHTGGLEITPHQF